jgi:hypothetical protein
MVKTAALKRLADAALEGTLLVERELSQSQTAG